MPDLIYHHVGIPTNKDLPDGGYVPERKFTAYGYSSNPYGIEWMRFDRDSPVPELVKTVPHVGFVVEDIQKTIEGKKVINEPRNPVDGVTTVTIEDNGAPIEFLQFHRPESEIWPHPTKFKAQEFIKYHHIGIPTKRRLEDETHLKHLKMYVCGYGENPYGVEWMRFENDAPYPELVKTVAHVAFEVDNIEEAIKDKKVIIQPNSPSPGITVAFIEDIGAPIEFIQIDKSIRE
jgi:hypothetical protein